MFLELGKALSFILSILSLYPIVVSAFFVPGTHWEERLSMSIAKIGMAGCVCFASGLFFCREAEYVQGRKVLYARSAGQRLMRTLPVQMFLWTLAGVAILFLVSWYLEEFYVPLMWRNQPYEIALALGWFTSANQ